MRLKTNLVISLVFIALLGFVYFYEIKGGEERRVQAERALQMLDFSDHEVQRLTIDSGDTLLVLERQEDEWKLTSPIQTDVDVEAVERYLRTLHEVEVEGEALRDSATITEDPELLGGYGLEEPRLRVHIGLTSDAQVLDTLRLGDDSPTDRFTYIQRGGTAVNPEVLRVRAWRFDNLNKGLFDLRDRRVLAFTAEDVRRLRLRREDGSTVEAVRETGTWQLQTPLARPGDNSAINGILTGLQEAKVDHILAESPSAQELAAAGLEPTAPGTELTLWVGDDRAEKRLLVGVEAPAGGLQAMDTSRPHIFLIDSTLVQQLRTPFSELRDKQVLRVSTTNVSSITMQEHGVVLFAARQDTSGEWMLIDQPGREAKSWRFNNLLTDVNGLQATRFAADADSHQDLPLDRFGLGTPAWVLVFSSDDGSETRLQVGNRGDGEAFVIGDDMRTIHVVDDDAMESLYLNLDDVSLKQGLETDDSDTDPGASQ